MDPEEEEEELEVPSNIAVEERAFVTDFMNKYYDEVVPWEDVGKLGASEDESGVSDDDDLLGKRTYEEEFEEDDEDAFLYESPHDEPPPPPPPRTQGAFDPDYEYLKKIAYGSDKPTPDQLLKMADEPKTYLPVVHPDVRAECQQILQWYAEDDFEPGRDPCILCELGFAEGTMDRGNDVVHRFMAIYLSQRGKSHPRAMTRHMASYWNTELHEEYEKIGIRNTAKLVPSAIYHHLHYHVRDPAEMNYQLAKDMFWLARSVRDNSIFRNEYKYGESTDTLEVSPANLRMFGMLGSSAERHLKAYHTYALDSQWLHVNQHLGTDAMRQCSNTSVSRAMNRLGGKIVGNLKSKEMNSTM